MYYSTENQQVASEPTLVDVADPNDALVYWQGIGQDDVLPVESDAPMERTWKMIGAVGSMAGMVGGAYHGYKRNKSIGWAIGWGLLGGIFWPIAIPVMLAQGFAKPKGS